MRDFRNTIVVVSSITPEILAAHHACHGNGAFLASAITSISSAQSAIHTVQRFNGLSALALTLRTMMCPPFYVFEIKAVHGLAVFQHHIVGDIHNVVDGAHAHSAQPLAHPAGGRLDSYVFHHGAPDTLAQDPAFSMLHLQKICCSHRARPLQRGCAAS